MYNNNAPPRQLPEVVIRLARKSDLEALCNLLAQLFSIEVDFEVNRHKQLNGLELLLQDTSHARVFVVEIKHQLVAMCTLQIVVSTASGGQSAWLEDVIVEQNFRHQGIGTALLNQVMAWCEKNQVHRLQLLADETNPQAGVFYRHGSWQATQLRVWRKTLNEK